MNPQKTLGLSLHVSNALDAIDTAVGELEWYACNLNIGDPFESYVRGRITSRIDELKAIAKELDNVIPDERRDAE